MSLLTTYSAANKRTSAGLSTYYQWEYDETSKPAPFHKIERIRTKRYSYTGMTKTAADACVAAMQTYWTRDVQRWYYDYDEAHSGATPRWMIVSSDYPYAQELVADISSAHDGGDMWRVDIAVNEKVAWYGAVKPADLDLAFRNIYGIWSYDE